MFNKADIEKYFVAEKQMSFYGLFIAAAIIITAIVFFFFLKTNFYKGVSVSLFVFGILLLFAGFTVYKRSDSDRTRNVYAYDMNPCELRDKELPRMKKVMKNFVVLRYAEIFFMLVGIGLFVYFRNNETRYFWKGLGLALAIVAILGFIIDTTAEKRCDSYTKGLESFLSNK